MRYNEQTAVVGVCLYTPVSFVNDEVPPSDLVESGLLDVGDLVRRQEHVPVTLVLRCSRLQLVPNDRDALVLRTPSQSGCVPSQGGADRVRVRNEAHIFNAYIGSSI